MRRQKLTSECRERFLKALTGTGIVSVSVQIVSDNLPGWLLRDTL
jgi:hypothetical protein